MLKYIVRRLLIMLPIILGIIFIVFSILEFTPGDPVSMILGQDATPELIKLKREELGLNKPFLTRYITYVLDIVRGDFGTMYASGNSVGEAIARRLPVTLELSILSILLAVIVGIPLGVLSAVKQYSIIDIFSILFAMILSAMPGFWLGLMLILIFSTKLGLFPSFGVGDGLISFILPCITLSATYTAVIVRMTRSCMLEVINQDYVRTARAKGATESHIIGKHALRNAMLPVLTTVGMYFGALMGGAVIAETVFSLPGLGTLLVSGITAKDTPTVLGCVTVIATSISLINLSVDVAYAYIDPRIKAQYASMGLVKVKVRKRK